MTHRRRNPDSNPRSRFSGEPVREQQTVRPVCAAELIEQIKRKRVGGYNVFPRSAATRASLRFSFASSNAMRASVSSSCCFSHSTQPLA